MSKKPNMLIFDTAYSYNMIIERKMTGHITSRNPKLYFNKIWSVNPISSIVLDDSKNNKYGKTEIHKFNDNQIFVEGKIGRYSKLKKFKIINFILAQFHLFLYIYKLIKRNNIQIIRSEDAWYCGFCAFIFSKILLRKILLVGVWGNPDTFREISKRPMMPKLYKFIWIEKFFETFVLKRADKILVQNHDNLSFVLKKGITQRKTEIFKLGNIINASHFIDPKQREFNIIDKDINYLINSNNKIILCISRLEKMKLSDHFIYLCSELKKNNVSFKALYVGDGSMRENLKVLAKQYDLKKEILFCGNQNQEWISELLPYTDVVVSFITGRALVEASLGGVPIVAYDIEWQKELIENNITGLLVKAYDYGNMANKIEYLFNNKNIAENLGNNLRNRTLEYMNPQKIEKEQINFYDTLLSK